MFRFVEDRVEQEMLGPGTNKLGKLVETFSGTTPDRVARCHIGIAIAYTKPFAQAPFGASTVIVDREVNPLRHAETRGVAARFLEIGADLRCVLHEVCGRG